MSKYLTFEPVRSLQALQGLLVAIIMCAAFVSDISGEGVALLTALAGAFVIFLGTFVRKAVTPNPTVDDLADLLPPEIKAALEALKAAS